MIKVMDIEKIKKVSLYELCHKEAFDLTLLNVMSNLAKKQP